MLLELLVLKSTCSIFFLWILVKNIRHTRSNLEMKGIHMDTSCPLVNLLWRILVICLCKMQNYKELFGFHPRLVFTFHPKWILDLG
jgi:hypothetical protein